MDAESFNSLYVPLTGRSEDVHKEWKDSNVSPSPLYSKLRSAQADASYDDSAPPFTFVQLAPFIKQTKSSKQTRKSTRPVTSTPWERLTKPTSIPLAIPRSSSNPDVFSPGQSFMTENGTDQEPMALLNMIREIDQKSQKLLAEYHNRIHSLRCSLPEARFSQLKDELSRREVDYIRFLENATRNRSAKDVFAMMIASKPLVAPLSRERHIPTDSLPTPVKSSSLSSEWKPTFDHIYDKFVDIYSNSDAALNQDYATGPTTSEADLFSIVRQQKPKESDQESSDSSFYSDDEPIRLSPRSLQRLAEVRPIKESMAKHKTIAVETEPMRKASIFLTYEGIQTKFSRMTKKGRRNQGVVLFLNMEQKKETMGYYFDLWRQNIWKNINTFRTVFWPFYVWRRHTLRKRPLNIKGRLLAQLVNTVRLMRYFRPWVRYHRYRKLLHEREIEFTAIVKRRFLERIWQGWWGWHEPRRARSRIVRSVDYRRLRWKSRAEVYFRALYLYTRYCKMVKQRGLIYIGRITAPGLVCLEAPSNLTWLHELFTLKDAIHRRISQFRCRKVIPRVFECWREYIFSKKKKRYAYRHWRTHAIRAALRAWKKATLLIRAMKLQKKNDEDKSRKLRLDSHGKYLQTLRSIDPSSLSADDQVLTRKIEDLRRRDDLNRSRQKQLLEIAKTRDIAVENFLRDQSHKLMNGQGKEAEYYANQANKLRRRVAVIFLTKLDSFVEKYRWMQVKKWVRRCFNSLAATILERRAISFANRHMLKRLIYFCTRLRRFNRRVQWRNRVKLMWNCLSAWRHVVTEYRGNRSADELTLVRRRKYLFNLYSRRAALGHDQDDLRSCFYRWLEFGQKRIARRRICELIMSRRIWRIFQQSFYRWRYRVAKELEPHPEENRLSASLWLWADYFGRPMMFKDQMAQTTKDRQVEVAEAMLCLPKYRYRKRYEEFDQLLDVRIRHEQFLLLLYFEAHPNLLPASKHMDIARLRNVELKLILDHCKSFGMFLMSGAISGHYKPFTNDHIAFRLSRWMFEARSHQLLKLNDNPDITVDPELPTSAAYWQHIRFLISLVAHPEYPSNLGKVTINTFRTVAHIPTRRERSFSVMYNLTPPRGAKIGAKPIGVHSLDRSNAGRRTSMAGSLGGHTMHSVNFAAAASERSADP